MNYRKRRLFLVVTREYMINLAIYDLNKGNKFKSLGSTSIQQGHDKLNGKLKVVE